jgi:hypothetical protein
MGVDLCCRPSRCIEARQLEVAGIGRWQFCFSGGPTCSSCNVQRSRKKQRIVGPTSEAMFSRSRLASAIGNDIGLVRLEDSAIV